MLLDNLAMIRIQPQDSHGCIAISLALDNGVLLETRSFILSPQRKVRITTRDAASPVVRVSCGSVKIRIRAASIHAANAWAKLFRERGFAQGVHGSLSSSDEAMSAEEGHPDDDSAQRPRALTHASV